MTTKLRFAPAPTGHLHVGNLRAALVNWLYARKSGGLFLLRIDDTDAERSRKDYEESIKNDLTRLGLTWDEEAHQSARFERYDAAAEKLKSDGRLYACYETPEELALKRKSQLNQGLPPIYDRGALKMTEEQIAAYEAEGRKPHWRFKLNHEPIEWNDLVQAETHFEGQNLSDPIVIREDGSYLYTLPTCVDDVELGVTHIVRGVDHLANTATHVQIIEALGGKRPEFAHLPLLSDAAGGKLSKRIGSLGVRDLVDDQGLEPMTLLSVMARIGTSDNIDGTLDIQDLIDGFEFKKISRASAKFDPELMTRINAKLMHDMPYAAVETKLKSMLGPEADEEFWETVRPNIETFAEVEDWWKMTKLPLEPVIEDADFTKAAATLLPEGALTIDTWPIWVDAVKTETGRKGKDLFMPLRQALTGRQHGPELQHLLPLIGRERVIKRLSGEQA